MLWGGVEWKSQNRKNVYLSPYVEEPLNSKVIKSFVTELRSRVFRVSGFLCSIYMCVMNIRCTFHILMYGYVTRYPTDVKSAGFPSLLEASRGRATMKSCDTTKQSVNDNLYIYIYICSPPWVEHSGREFSGCDIR